MSKIKFQPTLKFSIVSFAAYPQVVLSLASELRVLNLIKVYLFDYLTKKKHSFSFVYLNAKIKFCHWSLDVHCTRTCNIHRNRRSRRWETNRHAICRYYYIDPCNIIIYTGALKLWKISIEGELLWSSRGRNKKTKITAFSVKKFTTLSYRVRWLLRKLHVKTTNFWSAGGRWTYVTLAAHLKDGNII